MNDDLRARADAVERRAGVADDRICIAYEGTDGRLLDMDGDPVPPDVSPIVVLPRSVVSTWTIVDLPDEVDG